MSPQGGSGEKTEKATAKKRRDARNRGQVLKSIEVNTAFCSLVIFGFMYLFFEQYITGLAEMMGTALGSVATLSATTVWDAPLLTTVYLQVLQLVAPIILPILLCAFLSGVAINVAQVRFLFTTKPLIPSLSKINPISGFKKLFSLKGLSELIKSLIKVIALGYILYREYQEIITIYPWIMSGDLREIIIGFMERIFMIAIQMSFVLAIIALFDYLYQWWQFEKDLKMTKQEVKDEFKQQEGDPKIKGKIRQKQMQMSAMRMMEQVPQADVVITNPTHYAIALKYDLAVAAAPIVLAKGQDFLARKIKETAQENSIEIVENKELARSLYQFCEIGDQVPPDLYQAVADVLVYVYRLKNNIRGGKR